MPEITAQDRGLANDLAPTAQRLASEAYEQQGLRGPESAASNMALTPPTG